MKTNANIPEVAKLFKEAKRPTNLTSLIIRRKGYKRGGKVYGDEKVHSTFITGFSYRKLCKKSLEELSSIKNEDILAELKIEYPTITLSHIVTARNDLMDSLTKSATESKIENVFDPLRVNGKVVDGCKVYSGTGKNDPRAPIPGTIYVQGLCVDQKILAPASNGPPPKISRCLNTVVKNHIRWKLSIGRYVSYVLAPGEDFELTVDGRVVAHRY